MAQMGVDIGSTGCKAVVFDTAGNQLAHAYREYPEIYPQPGWIELDPAEVWQSIQAVIREAAGAAGEPVRALALSAMGEAFTAVSREGEFLSNTVVSPDNRAVAEAQALADSLGAQRIFSLTGMPVHASFTLPKVMWMARRRPEIHDRVYKYLMWPDLVHFLSGLTPRLDHSLAGRTLAFDVVQRQWSPEMLAAAQLEADLFAEPIAPGEVVGALTGEQARQLGLTEGCLVVAGGHDQPMNALGAGVIAPGLAVDGMGTVECITVPFTEPLLTETMRSHNYCCYSHTVPGHYCTIAYNYSCGSLLRWYRDNFGGLQKQQAQAQGRDVYEVLLADLPEGPTGLLCLPYFAGSGTPYLDPLARGAVLGLTTGVTDKAMLKGLLEGVCYELRLNIESLARAGVPLQRLRATGGGSKSPLWLQLKADITGKEVVTLNVTEGGCLAGAILGGVALGEYASVAEAVATLVVERDLYRPDQGRHEQYNRYYELYCQAWPALREITHALT
jgi:xylulokinase